MRIELLSLYSQEVIPKNNSNKLETITMVTLIFVSFALIFFMGREHKQSKSFVCIHILFEK